METQPITPNTYESIQQFIDQLGADNILDAAIGLRGANYDPVHSAPILRSAYPGTTAQDLANTITTAWAGIVDNRTLISALQNAGYDAATINTVVPKAMSLTFLQNALYNSAIFLNKAVALYQGDLTHMKDGETVDYLIISALPNDYSPTPGSLIGALNSIGVSVASLAQHKAADYRTTSYCWVSQPITGQAFKRIICFEPTLSGNEAATQIPGIFTSLEKFAAPTAQNIVVATAMVCTGSIKASSSVVLTALFNGAKAMLPTKFPDMCFKIVNNNSSWTDSLNQLFSQLKKG